MYGPWTVAALRVGAGAVISDNNEKKAEIN
jgi:hypothetical protein